MNPTMEEQNSLQYWKDLSERLEQKNKELLQELDEYTENSAQLERELEASLGQSEKRQEELTKQNKKLKNEINLLKSKLERLQHEKSQTETELAEATSERLKQAAYIRELEQKNDDLERGHRVVRESVICIESLLNEAYERNAILESEIDDLENMKTNLQRATDEARDLKQELKVLERLPKLKNSNGVVENGLDDSKHKFNDVVETETQTHDISRNEINGNPISPSTRVTALNIVGELLRKVGLEKYVCDKCNKVRCTCNVQKITPNVNEACNSSAKTNESAVTPNPNDNVNVELRHRPHAVNQYRVSDAPVFVETETNGRDFDRNGKMRMSFLSKSREGFGNLFRGSVRKFNTTRQLSRESN